MQHTESSEGVFFRRWMNLDHPISIHTMINSAHRATVKQHLKRAFGGITALCCVCIVAVQRKFCTLKAKKTALFFPCCTKYCLIHHFGDRTNESHWSQGCLYSVPFGRWDYTGERSRHTTLLSVSSQKDTVRASVQAQLASFHVPLGLCKYPLWAEHR